MNRSQTPGRPRPTNAKNKKKQPRKNNSVDWLTNHWTLVVVAGLAILVIIVIIAASLGGGDSNNPAEPEPRPDSSKPYQVGDLELVVHQWDCGRTVFEHLDNPDRTIDAADGNHFCTLGVKVSNLNTEKLRAFDRANPKIRFNGQEYGYHLAATRDGLGAQTGLRTLAAGIGTSADTVAPLINMVFEIPQDGDGEGSPTWRQDAVLLIPTTDDSELPLEINLLDYDKQ